jgi:hypothetical protein
MRFTILHALALLVLGARAGAAQVPPAADPLGAHRWHVETEASAAFEAWNYNISHEDLFGLNETVMYGVGDGVALRMGQRFVYVSQRAEDAVLLGLTIGVRQRLARRGRLTAFVQGDVGISYTAIASPPRGTRFNYLAIGGGGVLVGLRPRVHFVATLLLTHISNASLKGPGRNPDIEAIGTTAGLNFRF